MNQILLSFGIILLIHAQPMAQGCATVRNISEFGQYVQQDLGTISSPWIVSINNRYYKAYRDFRGTEDVTPDPQNETINRNFTTEFAISRLLNHGWSMTMVVPIMANSREASREHGGPDTERFTQHAFGLGDITFTVYKWLLDPVRANKGNVQIGLGFKLPTGDFIQKDYFHRPDTLIVAPVNPGIQPGDGGLGLIAEVNAYYRITDPLHLYANLYYMANPRVHNGESWGGFSYTEEQVEAGIDVMSVPDAFSLRAGVSYDILSNLTLSGGLRFEGVPVRDLIGGSTGSRRPGYYLSIEPGFVFRTNTVSFFGSVPIFISRDIKQSVGGEILGVHGPGGSADYMVFLGALFKI